jgi:hypothetical protein
MSDPSPQHTNGLYSAETTEEIEIDEVQVAPGVYLTDFRHTSVVSSSSPSSSSTPSSGISQSCGTELNVAYEVTELENSIKHLVRSNVELARAMEEDPDPLYAESIRENLAVIAKRKQKRDELLEQQQKKTGWF